MKKYRIEAGKRCFSDVPGAVFVSWDTDIPCAKVRSAMLGIKKIEGCVMYCHCLKPFLYLCLTRGECNLLYYDHPKREEAWLVLPSGTGYEWIRIDDQIEFS